MLHFLSGEAGTSTTGMSSLAGYLRYTKLKSINQIVEVSNIFNTNAVWKVVASICQKQSLNYYLTFHRNINQTIVENYNIKSWIENKIWQFDIDLSCVHSCWQIWREWNSNIKCTEKIKSLMFSSGVTFLTSLAFMQYCYLFWTHALIIKLQRCYISNSKFFIFPFFLSRAHFSNGYLLWYFHLKWYLECLLFPRFCGLEWKRSCQCFRW